MSCNSSFLFSDDSSCYSSLFGSVSSYIPLSPSYSTPVLTSVSDESLDSLKSSHDVPSMVTLVEEQSTNPFPVSQKYADTSFTDFIPAETDPLLQSNGFLQCPEVCNGHELYKFLDSFMTWSSYGDVFEHEGTGARVYCRSIHEECSSLDDELYLTVYGSWESCLRIIRKLGMWAKWDITKTGDNFHSSSFRLYFVSFHAEYLFQPKNQSLTLINQF